MRAIKWWQHATWEGTNYLGLMTFALEMAQVKASIWP